MPRVEANGIDVYYEEYGQGTPIVVLHGATADHRTWAEQLQPLADDYRIIPLDLRGHGKTGTSNLDTYTVDVYVEDLVAFIDALNLSQPVILGHSWGGMIGYRFAAQHPDKLSALVTVGATTSHTLSKGEWVYKSVFFPAVTLLMDNDRIMNGINWLLERVFGEDAGGDTDELDRLREQHRCDVPEINADERSKIFDALTEYWGSSRPLEPITVPVLMLYGENELPFPSKHADFLQEKLEQCQVEEIPEAGHNSQADNPEFILSRIREFMTPNMRTLEAESPN